MVICASGSSSHILKPWISKENGTVYKLMPPLVGSGSKGISNRNNTGSIVLVILIVEYHYEEYE